MLYEGWGVLTCISSEGNFLFVKSCIFSLSHLQVMHLDHLSCQLTICRLTINSDYVFRLHHIFKCSSLLKNVFSRSFITFYSITFITWGNISAWSIFETKCYEFIPILQNLPQQTYKSDCGVFTCQFANYVCRRKPITFTQVSISLRILLIRLMHNYL